MGILSGSTTYLRFRVEGGVGQNYIEAFERAIAVRRFIPLHPDGEDNESLGWVSFLKPYADEETILNSDFLFGDSVVLGFREDSIVYPKAMMRDKVKKRLEEHEKKNEFKPSVQIKKTIEAAVMSEFRKRVLPKTKVVIFQWDLSSSQVRLFARGKGIVDRFTDMFEQTFQVKLHVKNFANLAGEHDLSLLEKGFLETLEPQAIFRETIRVEVN